VSFGSQLRREILREIGDTFPDAFHEKQRLDLIFLFSLTFSSPLISEGAYYILCVSQLSRSFGPDHSILSVPLCSQYFLDCDYMDIVCD